MKAIICPDKFKGSLSALEVAKAIERGIKRFDKSINTIVHPLADGGEGSLTIFDSDPDVEVRKMKVLDPLGREIITDYRIKRNSAFIEMAKASGLALLEESEFNVMKASSYGTGQLIADALDQRCKKIYLFIGGSATNDGGMGIAAALGYRFFDEENRSLESIGKNLIEVSRIEKNRIDQRLHQISFFTICDVTNPFHGKNGAAHVYAKQKGASAKQIELLDKGLQNLAQIIERDIGKDIAHIRGSGAAGGIGGGSVAFLDAKIRPGIQTVMEMTGFEDACKNADLVISGEGKADQQSRHGKVISGVAALAKKNQIPLGLIVGINELDDTDLIYLNVKVAKDVLSKVGSLERAITSAEKVIEELSFEMIEEIFRRQAVLKSTIC